MGVWKEAVYGSRQHQYVYWVTKKWGIPHYYMGATPYVLGRNEIPYANTADPFCIDCS